MSNVVVKSCTSHVYTLYVYIPGL